MKKQITRKKLNSQIKACKTLSAKFDPGTKRWNRNRIKLNHLLVELDRRTITGEI